MSKASRKARGLRGHKGRKKRLDREIDEVLAQPLAKPKRRHSSNPTAKSAQLEREVTAALPARKASPTRKGSPTRKAGPARSARSPTSTSDIRSPTSTSTEVRSPTSTSTEVRSPTSTSTDAYTSGNVTVTGGAGAGATTEVKIYTTPKSSKESGKDARRADSQAHGYRSRGAQNRMTDMIEATMAPRTPAPMPGIMRSTGDRKTRGKPLHRSRSFDGAPWEQVPPGISSPKRSRLTYGKKTDAQLDAEIDEALAGKKL